MFLINTPLDKGRLFEGGVYLIFANLKGASIRGGRLIEALR